MDGKYSFDRLLEFLDYAGSKGILNMATAQSRKSASNKILSCLEQDEKTDLREFNLDEVFQRFMNLQGGQYTPQSLQVYKARVKTAVSDFISWADDPSSFKPVIPKKRKVRIKEQADTGGSGPESGGRASADTGPSHESAPDNSAAPLVFPIPLRDRSVVVRIQHLPNDLTKAEAKKVSTVLSSLQGYLLALTQGDGLEEE